MGAVLRRSADEISLLSTAHNEIGSVLDTKEVFHLNGRNVHLTHPEFCHG
jgi:hypothetical protein